MSYENYDPCFPDQPVADLYLPIWASQPAFRAKPAFIWAQDSSRTGPLTQSSISYSELDSSVRTIAANLRLTVQTGDTILLLCNPGLRLISLLFACQRAGLVAVPLAPPEPPMPGPALHHLLRAASQARPSAAVADSRYVSSILRSAASSLEVLGKLRWLSTDDLVVDKGEQRCAITKFEEVLGEATYLGCGPKDVYLVQYTSGATGVPKPVAVTAGAAAHNVRAARRAYDLHPSSVIVSWLPQYHDCGLMFLLLTIVSGATCVLASPASFVQRPRLWLELVTEFNATCTPVPSFALPLVLKRGGEDCRKAPLNLDSLRNLVLINEPIFRSIVEEFVAEFINVGLNPSAISPSYGLAENCTFVSTSWRSHADDTFPNIPTYNKLLPSARLGAIASSDEDTDMEIIVVDEETCEPVADGVEGEIWVSSASNAAGYIGHPSMTSEVFHARLPARAGRCFVRTGDRGVICGEERYLYIIGRIADVIYSGDRAVHPDYIETAAYKSNKMKLRGGCLAAFKMETAVVVLAELQKGGEGGDWKRMCEGIREGVWKEERVRVGVVALVRSGSVPKTTSGKLRRWLAREEFASGRLPVVFEVRYEKGNGEEGKKVGSVAEEEGGGGRRPWLLSFM